MLKDLLKKTRSFRRFNVNDRVPADLLKTWVTDLRYCASGRNCQPLKYAVVASPQSCAQIFPLLAWAGYLKDWAGPEEDERPSAYLIQLLDKEIAENCLCDDGIQLQTLLLSATEAGYGGCIIKAFKNAELRQLLRLPDHLQINYVLALGKPVEKVVVEEMKNNDVRYWRTPDGVHHVPKRPACELIFAEY